MVIPFVFRPSLLSTFGYYLERIRSLFFQPGKSKPEILTEVVTDTQTETLVQTREEGQVVVHCHFLAFPGALLRIWKTTFLIADSGARSSLVHAENITFAPVWTEIDDYGVYTFTLFFSPLPSSCSSFDLQEEIEQSGAFFVADIPRNESDVYHVWM
jgi:hypothetical protein